MVSTLTRVHNKNDKCAHFHLCPLASGAMTLDMPELRQISKDLREMHSYLSILRREDQLQDQWCHVGYILDFLLFRIYLLIITGYALVIICMWCIWMNQ